TASSRPRFLIGAYGIGRRWAARFSGDRGGSGGGVGEIGHLPHRQGDPRVRPLHAPTDPLVSPPDPSLPFHCLRSLLQFLFFLAMYERNHRKKGWIGDDGGRCCDLVRDWRTLLQHLENEFDALKEEHESLEEACQTPEESKASDRRKHNLRKREIKQGIRRLDKLMCSISSLLSALQLALEEMPDIQEVTLILGASIVRPQHVFQLVFSGGNFGFGNLNKCTERKFSDNIARKVGQLSLAIM
ncbi:hypothetical protein BHE74_00020525, partial [Ensete ventricosum]